MRHRLLSGVGVAILLVFLTGGALLLPSPAIAQQGVAVSVNALISVAPGGDFVASIDISQVENLDAANFDVVFNPDVLAIGDITPGVGITDGVVGLTAIPVVMTNEVSSGRVRVVLNVPGISGVSGSGYLCQIHFSAIGSEGTSSSIELVSGILSDNTATEIVATWVGATVNVGAPLAEPNISVSPTSKNFGSVTVGSSSSPQTVTVSNVGTATLTITDITISGPGSEEFSMSPYPDTIPAGDSAGVNVTFSPTSTGSKSATLTVTSNDPDEATVEVSLSGTGVTASPPPGGGGGAPPTYYTGTNLFGTAGSFRISATGEILQAIEATSADGKLTITIPTGTIARDKDGYRLSTLTTAVDPSPPLPPEGANIIELAYDFGPDGATFDPPITLEYTYDPAEIPEGVAEADLVLAFYNEATGLWVELPGIVDPVSHRIIATVSHFTTFAIIAHIPPPAPAAFSLSNLSVKPAEVQPREAVTVAVSVANTGGTEGSYAVVLKINGVKEAEKSVTVATGGSQTVTFSVTKEAGSYSVTVDGLSGSFTVVAPLVVEPAAFSVSNLSIQPAEVPTGEAVTIDVALTNTGGTHGTYTVVLKINGVREADRTVTIDAGNTLNITFPVIKEAAGSYTVTVDGLSSSFTVVAPVTNWPLIGGIIGAVIVIGLLLFFLVFRRRAH